MRTSDVAESPPAHGCNHREGDCFPERLGKNRHIETHELWLQDVVDRKRIELHKIKNSFNPADMFTKYLSRADMDLIVDRLDHAYEQGRSEIAPELSNINEVHPMRFIMLEQYVIKNYHV